MLWQEFQPCWIYNTKMKKVTFKIYPVLPSEAYETGVLQTTVIEWNSVLTRIRNTTWELYLTEGNCLEAFSCAPSSSKCSMVTLGVDYFYALFAIAASQYGTSENHLRGTHVHLWFLSHWRLSKSGQLFISHGNTKFERCSTPKFSQKRWGDLEQ